MTHHDYTRALEALRLLKQGMDTYGYPEQNTIDTHLETIRHALEAMAAQGWQDISAAPKDGTKVDLFVGGDYQYRAADCQYFKHAEYGEGWYRNDGENRINPVLITHWQPLPAPPALTPCGNSDAGKMGGDHE